ncbi:MAG: GAF domain-containing protein [Bryobacterales bacterium]|nr:GAF domain-containing protein [Bryobacterales bacterium]
MASEATAARLGGAFRTVVLLLLAALPALAQPWQTLTLDQAASRKNPDFSPAFDGRPVAVNGQVSILPFRFGDADWMAVEDLTHGLMLQAPPGYFRDLNPGDWVEARGRLEHRDGMPVLVVSRINLTSAGAPPEPRRVPVEELHSLRYLARRVTSQGRVVDAGENSDGVFLWIGEGLRPVKLFLLPAADGQLRRFGVEVGDYIRFTGLSFQRSPNPPYDGGFEVMIHDPLEVQRVTPAWLVRVWEHKPWVAFMVLSTAFWFWWKQNSTSQREVLRSLYRLSEEILEASSTGDIAARLAAVLPRLLRITSVRIYVFDRGLNSLQVIGSDGNGAPIGVDAPSGFSATGLVTCFQSRKLLAVPDTRRSPVAGEKHDKLGQPAPRALLYVPMMAQGEPVGVLAVEHDRRPRQFSPDEKEGAEHLGNQVGVVLKLLQQRSFREQLARSEKLAAVGRLLSGVVNDLHTPLAAITTMAQSSIESAGDSPSPELLVIASEAKRASAIVSRLVSFARPEQARAEPVNLSELLKNLIRFRDREWKASGIHVRNQVKDKALFIIGAQGQLEQVFLNLFVHAEQAIEESKEKNILVRADVLAKRVFIEITYSDPSSGATPLNEGEMHSLGLDVCRSVLTGHGGEMRLVRKNPRESTFEIEIPLLNQEEAEAQIRREAASPAQPLTCLLLEPEAWVARQLADALNARSYRVIPVRSTEEACDLIGRLRFDLVLCSTRLDGLGWVEFFDRVRGNVGAFLLLAEAFNHDLTMHFRGEGRFVLLKPIDREQLDRVLSDIAFHVQGAPQRAAELESY